MPDMELVVVVEQAFGVLLRVVRVVGDAVETMMWW